MNIAISGNEYTVRQENGAEVKFTESAGVYSAPPRVNATLTKVGTDYIFTRNQAEIFKFNAGGQLVSIKDLNNYETTVTRPNSSTLVVTDPAARALTFTLSSGKITSLTDPSGRTMAFGYTSGDLTQVTQFDNSKSTFTYDSSHRVLTMREPKYFGSGISPAPEYQNSYDSSNRVAWQKDQLGRQTTLDYTSVPGSTKITHPDGEVCLDTYQDGVRVSNTKGYGTGLQSTWSYTFDPVTAGIASVTDPNNRVTSMTYDGRGNRLTVTDALNHTSATTYNSLNQATSSVDALGNTSNMTYDAAGNLLTSTQVRTEPNPDVNETTTYTYGDVTRPGDVTKITNPEGEESVFVYNAYGDVSSATDATARKTTFNYNTPTSIGWVMSSVAPAGNATGGTPSQHTTVYERDNYGRVTATKDPLWSAGSPNDHRVTTTYDANGNVTSTTDGKGLTTAYAYNAANELISTTRPDATTLQSTYWPDGSLKTQTDGRGKVSNYAYDIQGRLSSMTDALNRVTGYVYDAAGNLTKKVDPGGSCTGTVVGCTTYAYDNANRQTGINYSDVATPDVTFGYDNANRRTSMVDGTGTSTYTYDSMSRLTGTTNGGAQAVSYGYDRASRQTSITYPGNKTVNRYFDDVGSIVNWNGDNTIYTYDANGNLTKGDLGNNIDQITAYNRANEPVNNKYDAGWNIGEFVANRNGAGQVTSTQVWGDLYGSQQAKTYSYDQVNRLSSINGQTAGYDNGDNPTTVPGSISQSFDDGNQLTTSGHDGGTSYAHDTRGNRTLSTPAAANAMPVTYGYDQASRLKSASSVTSPNVSYESAVMADTPRGYWRFNETSGAVADNSGYGRNASTSGWVTRGTGGAVKSDPANKAYHFDNNDAQIWIGEVYPNTTSGQDSAAEFYMRWDNSAGQPETVFSFGSGYGLSFNNNSFGFSTKTDTSDIYGIDATNLKNKWVHVVGVFRNGSTTASKLYIDGVQQTLTQRAGTTTAKSSDTWATAGANGNGTSDFNGRIDELSIYNTGLTQARVTAHYKASQSFSATYNYDGTGLRQSKTVNGVTNNMLWDTSGELPLLLSDGNYSFIYGADGLPLSQFDAAGNLSWFGHDTQGNTRMLMRNDGLAAGSFDYDAYGKNNNGFGSRDTTLKFQGQYEDTESGLLYLRARYHDPKTNQFLSVDPLLPITRSAYGYANNDGVNYGDPTGMIVPFVLGAYAVVELGLSAWDAYNTATTLADQCATGGQKAAAGGLFILGAVAPGAGYSGIGKAAGKSAKASKALSPNQMNKAIERGQAPKGITRVDTPQYKGEQLHVHLDDGAALNQDGTWRHGETKLTNKQRDWLLGNGWELPE